MTDYQILRGAIRVGRQSFVAGEAVSGDLLDRADILSMTAEGRIAPIADVPVAEAIAAQPVEARGKWTVNPETLEGKRLVELRAMIREREPGMDVSSIKSKKIAKKLLTKDWRDEYETERDIPSLDKTEAAERGIIEEARRKAQGDF
jgi:hypothetical protein